MYINTLIYCRNMWHTFKIHESCLPHKNLPKPLHYCHSKWEFLFLFFIIWMTQKGFCGACLFLGYGSSCCRYKREIEMLRWYIQAAWSVWLYMLCYLSLACEPVIPDPYQFNWVWVSMGEDTAFWWERLLGCVWQLTCSHVTYRVLNVQHIRFQLGWEGNMERGIWWARWIHWQEEGLC